MKDLVDKNSIIVLNKIDQDTDNMLNEIKNFNPIHISIKKDLNLDKLINKIKDNLKNKLINLENTLITRSRHRENLEQCLIHLNNFEKQKSQNDFDKGAEDLRLATRYLGTIVGKVDVEEILGSIFSDFCIGK